MSVKALNNWHIPGNLKNTHTYSELGTYSGAHTYSELGTYSGKTRRDFKVSAPADLEASFSAKTGSEG